MTSPTRHQFEAVYERGKRRATCACGWKALGLDGTTHAAEQAWYAHMYATGHRTREAIEKAAA